MIILSQKDQHYYTYCIATNPEEETYMLKTIKAYGPPTYDVETRSWLIPKNCYDELANSKFVKQKTGSGLKLSLFNYQEEVVNFCLNKKDALIVLPCGSGKTPIGIALYSDAKQRGFINGTGLIVVKATLKVQWLKEVSKFSNLKAVIIQSQKAINVSFNAKIKRLQKQLDEALAQPLGSLETANRIEDLSDKIHTLSQDAHTNFLNQFDNVDLFIVNYETLKDAAVRKELRKRKLEFVFADEVHYIKTDTASRSKALCEFADIKMRFGATATPIQKNPLDAYSIAKFVAPSIFPSKSKFSSRYLVYSGYGMVSGSKNDAELKKKLDDFMIVKTKEEVSDSLPSIVPITRYCSMDDKQIDMTEQIFAEIKDLKEQEKQLMSQFSNEAAAKADSRVMAIEANIVARQTFAQELADSEELLITSDSDMAQNYVTGVKTSAKLELLIDLLEEIISSGEKACVFSKYKRMQSIITDRILKETKTNSTFKDIKIAYVNGSLSSEQRYEEVYTKFRDDNSYKVLLMSDAGAEGVNLSTTKYLIEYEPADSYLIQTQRRGRIERADSTHDTVFAYQLIAEDSYDEVGLKIIAKKEGYDSRIIKGNLDE